MKRPQTTAQAVAILRKGLRLRRRRGAMKTTRLQRRAKKMLSREIREKGLWNCDPGLVSVSTVWAISAEFAWGMKGFGDALLDFLGAGFHHGVAPDGTPVLSTPFNYVTGDAVEVAVWRDEGSLILSDRGGLVNALLLAGVDAVESETCRRVVQSTVLQHGARLDGGAIVRPTTATELGPAVRDLVQSLIDGQVAGLAAPGRSEPEAEAPVYAEAGRRMDAYLKWTGHYRTPPCS